MKMKSLTIFLALTFSVMFSSSLYAGWTKMGEGASASNRGSNFYVDFERIRKVDGYVYFWELTDYLKPTPQGHLSGKIYKQGDCKLFRIKYLSFSFHKEPMGGGTGDRANTPDRAWDYPPPNSVEEFNLKSVCNR